MELGKKLHPEAQMQEDQAVVHVAVVADPIGIQHHAVDVVVHRAASAPAEVAGGLQRHGTHTRSRTLSRPSESMSSCWVGKVIRIPRRRPW